MGHDRQPGKYEGAVSVLPNNSTDMEIRPVVENFFAQNPEVDEGPDLMAAFDAAVATRGLATHSLERKELMWQRDLLAQLRAGSNVSIYDGSGPLYGTLLEAPAPTDDPLRYQLTIANSQNEEITVRVAALSSIMITEG